jgi:hypothetical protein
VNDYNVQKTTSTDVVDLVWFGHPGDSPCDVCARQFIVKWHADSALSEHACSVAAEDKKIALCWVYYCRGVCSVINEGYDSVQSESGDDPDVADSSSSDAEESEPATRKRKQRCQNRIKLVVGNDIYL